MKLKQMSTREQLLVLVTVVVLVGGGYGLLRIYPALKALKAITESTAATETRLRSTEIPEMPDRDEEAVQRQIRDAEQELAAIQHSATDIEQRLAEADSQELRLRISSLAQQSGIFIHESKAYVAVNPLQTAVASAPARMSKRARRAAAATAAANPAAATVAGPELLPESAGLLARMAPGTSFQRPMQQLGMEGDFEGIKHFIRGLDTLPWQVTVLQIKLEAQPSAPPVGMPQRLSVSMILAL